MRFFPPGTCLVLVKAECWRQQVRHQVQQPVVEATANLRQPRLHLAALRQRLIDHWCGSG
jgi:hypothetical protein